MTCASVLETLLEAAPSELSTDSPTPLGNHLRGCARCRRLALQLLADTRLLATAMETASVRSRRPIVRRWSVAPAFAVAALLVLMVWRARPADGPATEAVVVDVAPPPVFSAPHAPPNVSAVRAVTRPRVQLAAERAFPRPVPVAPVRLARTEGVVTAGEVGSRAVTVDPPPGTRAAVLHTGNPKLVVVWLY